MRTVVLGGAGYIGSVVAAQLCEAGHDVIVGDNLERGHREAVPTQAEFVEIDIRDGQRLRAVLAGCDAVLHFAALSVVPESVAAPLRYYEANVGGSVSVLEAMRAEGVRRIVFSSTAAVYGEPERMPIDEDAPTRPTHPYGATKLAVDQAISFAAAAYGLEAVSLRYFNVAGAYGRFGERHEPETHLIPLVLRAAAGSLKRVTVFGTDYATPDGTAVRDYIHVADLAAAHILALESEPSSPHRVYNLGNGSGYSVMEVIQVARSVTGRPIAVEEAERRPGDPSVLVASSARAHLELGWRPTRPALETIVADAWAWHRQHLEESCAESSYPASVA
jgi:UDP-glucose 4-epimerase